MLLTTAQLVVAGRWFDGLIDCLIGWLIGCLVGSLVVQLLAWLLDTTTRNGWNFSLCSLSRFVLFLGGMVVREEEEEEPDYRLLSLLYLTRCVYFIYDAR